MRLKKADRSWSQQQLVTRLGMEPGNRLAISSWDRQRLLIHAAKTALAAGLCWWLAQRFHLSEGYWGAISAIIVLQSNVGSTVSASRDRILGTLIGAILGFSCTLFGTLPWNYILAILAAVIVCGLLGLRESSRLAAVSMMTDGPPPRRSRRRRRTSTPSRPGIDTSRSTSSGSRSSTWRSASRPLSAVRPR